MISSHCHFLINENDEKKQLKNCHLVTEIMRKNNYKPSMKWLSINKLNEHPIQTVESTHHIFERHLVSVSNEFFEATDSHLTTWMLSSMHSSKKWYHKENVFGIHVDGSMTNTLVHIQDFKISTHQSDWQSYLRDYRIYVEFFISRWSYANFQDDYFIFNLWPKN